MLIWRVCLVAGLALVPGTQMFAVEESAAQSLWIANPVSGKDKPRGYLQFQNYCFECHGEGEGKPGTMALREKYKDTNAPALLEERTDLTPDSVKYFVRRGVLSMPGARKTEISDEDLDAIADYLSRSRIGRDLSPTLPAAVRRAIPR